MNESRLFFHIEMKENVTGEGFYGFRFVSYYNGTRGPWRDYEQDAREDGERHVAILKHLFFDIPMVGKED